MDINTFHPSTVREKKTMSLFRSSTVSAALACVICAVFAAEAEGPTTYTFLRADIGGRAAAMAGTFVSQTEDPNCLFYNPAGLGMLQQPAGSIGFFKHLMDINAGSIAFAYPLEDVGVLSAGIVYFNYGSFDETDDLGTVLGSFSAGDLAVSAGYAGQLEENLTYGASTKLIYSQIAGYSSTGIGFDAGVLYRIPESKVTVGAAIRNVGTQLSRFAETREDLPLDLTVGGSIIPRGLPLVFSVNFHKLNETGDSFGDRFRNFSVGGEFTLSPVLQLRFGYNNEQRRELKIGTSSGLAGFSGGLGVTVDTYRVDYALSSLGKIGSLHRVTIGAIF
jgi:hypothetical protein